VLGRRIVRPLGVAAVSVALLAVPGLQATAQAKAPEAPTQLRAVPQENPIDPKQPLMRLRWTPPADKADITGYRVYVDGELLETVRAVTCPEINPQNLLRWCANVTALQVGQVYEFSVTAVSKGGESKPVAVQRMAVIAPTEPLNVQVVPDQQSLYVSWDPPLSTGGGDIKRYVVRTSSFRPGPQPACERSHHCDLVQDQRAHQRRALRRDGGGAELCWLLPARAGVGTGYRHP